MRWKTITDGLWYASFKRDRRTHTIFVRKFNSWDDDDNFIVDAYDKGLYDGGNCLVFARCRPTPEGLECVHWCKYHETGEMRRERVEWTFRRAVREMPEAMEQAGTFMRDEVTRHLLRVL